MKLATVPATSNENDVFQDINRLFRCFQKGILSEYETMVMIAASATESVRQHVQEVAQERQWNN